MCQTAKCPNRGECFSEGTATFLIMGDACTRGCRFCAVETRPPAPLDPDEPRVSPRRPQRMGLRHVVVTTVTRDDLPDGGAAHFVAVIEAVRAAVPECRGRGAHERLRRRACERRRRGGGASRRLQPQPRDRAAPLPRGAPGADYARSLGVLERVRETQPDLPTKSGLMLGPRRDAATRSRRDARPARQGVSMLTLGQYLRPSKRTCRSPSSSSPTCSRSWRATHTRSASRRWRARRSCARATTRTSSPAQTRLLRARCPRGFGRASWPRRASGRPARSATRA